MDDKILDPEVIDILVTWGRWTQSDHERIGYMNYTNEFRLMKEGVLIASTGSNLDDDPISEKVDKIVAQLPCAYKKILCTRFIYCEGRRLEALRMRLTRTAYQQRVNIAIAFFSGRFEL